MLGDQLVDPGEPIEMVFVKESRFWHAQGGEYTGLIPAEDRSVRDIGEARDCE
jgi:hypothetical protein